MAAPLANAEIMGSRARWAIPRNEPCRKNGSPARTAFMWAYLSKVVAKVVGDELLTRSSIHLARCLLL